MNLCKRVLSLAALLLGLVGLVGCTAAIVGAWLVSGRLSQATEDLFGKIDGAFIVVGERVAQTQDRLQAAKTTTEDVEKALKGWAKREAGERLVLRVEAEEKAERLAFALMQADQWLELSASSAETVQGVLSMGSSTGAPTETVLLDRLLEEIGALRGQLAEAAELVEGIRGHTADDGGEKTLDQRIDQAAQLALRVIATLSSVDSRLEKFEGRLSETRQEVLRWKTTTLRWIVIATIGVSLVMAWMGAGQVALCFFGWKGLGRARARRPPQEETPSPQSAGEGNE